MSSSPSIGPTSGARGGARSLLLHDPAHNADSHAVIRPLRLGLAEAGWDTLSLQLPTPYPGETHQAWLARSPSIAARIRAGLDWLKQQGQLNQVLLAEGGSSAALLQFASQGTPAELQALVLISPPLEQGSAGLSALGEVKLPLLDVYAERDLAVVRDGADLRRRAAQGSPDTRYRQRMVAGAVADYPGLQDALLATVRSWLAATAEGRPVPIKP